VSYLDTNIVIAYGFREEPNHEKAKMLVEDLKYREIIYFIIIS
jgi:predicted nucleic acid-binding protein